MKQFSKLFFAAAVAALGLASCAKEVAPVETPKDNLVTVHFGATAGIEGATKATLTTEDELTFTSAWENGDVLSVKYLSPSNEEKIIPATWNMDSFEAALPNEKGEWYYQACYPKPDEKDNHIDFCGARTQNGNNYNSTYDVMICDLFSVEDAGAGKTADGSNVVFNMKRETAVAYFHLTDGPADEDLVSATLSVEGGFIASQHAYISDFAFAPTKDLTEITITFPEKAPKASNFQLWYNVLPTKYTKMTLTVETANHTLTISRTAEGKYEAGKLYKVSKSIPAENWAPKAAYTGGDLVFDFKTVKPEGWPTSKDKAPGGTYKYAVNGVDYSFILGKGGYCAGTTPNSAYLMITKSSSLGLPAIAGYKLTKVIGTLNDAGNPSKKAEICITDGANVVSGGTAQTWDTMGKDYTYTLAETEENTVYYLSVSSTANCQMTKLVLSYEPATPSAPKYSVSFASVEGGTLSASAIKAEEGTEITLTAEPQLGYEFNSDWSVVATDGTVINVVDNKFTMPAQDVTVFGTFSESTSTPTFASLAELVATGAPSTTARKVTVTLTDEEIIRFHTLKDGTVAGAIIKVGKQEVEIFCTGTPSDWKVGGTISGTLTNCDWMLYVNKSTQKETWELCPADYSELTYKAPLPTCATPVITIAEGGVVSIACETAGATIHYTVGDSPADPTEADKVFSTVTLTDGQTIKAIAFAEGYKPSAVASKKYTVGGLVEYVSTFTDKDLNTKEKVMTWTSSLEANSFDSDFSRGVQFGAAKGEFTITGTGHASNVKKISVIISSNQKKNANTISATVGGVAIGKQISLTNAKNYEIVFESTTELSGDIVFNVNDKDKSVYIKSITVNPAN